MENKYFQPPFCVNGNKLCITKFVGGQEKDVPLCNFTARIVEDITVTNGVENERFLGIIGEDENGNPLRKITIPIKSFSQLEWAQEQWNMNCVIEAGYGNKDSLRQAIQSTAKYAETKIVYGTTGWWETPDGWEFCMPGGKNEAKLPEKTNGYSFETDGDNETTLKTALSLAYSVAPQNVMFPMIAYIIGSLLNTFMVKVGKEPKSVIMLYGKTGSMKTTLSLLLCSFFGRFNEDNIPMSFRDTPKSIIRYCFLLKDCPVLIDDYYPGSSREQSAQDTATQYLIREICNREARGALDRNRKQVPAERPQCNAIMTAEYLPNIGESGAARFIPLELKPGDINLDELSEYQRFAEDGTLSHFTYLATEMIKEKYLNKENGEQELVSYLKETFLQNREFFRDKAREYNFKIRPRLCEDIANLEIGWELYCNTLQYYGVITEDEAEYNKELKKLNMLKAEIIKCLQGESDFSSSVLSELITQSEEKCSKLKEVCNAAEAELKNEEQLLDELFDKYDKLISWAELYETASHEAKKMIVNSMIKRIEVFRDYKLNIEFSFDLQQFMNGIDCEPLKAS